MWYDIYEGKADAVCAVLVNQLAVQRVPSPFT